MEASGIYNPRGIWSDGVTMWVADIGWVKIYAYDLATRERVPHKDFGLLGFEVNFSPTGIWFDGGGDVGGGPR